MWCGLLVQLPTSKTSRKSPKGPTRIESCPPSFGRSQSPIDRLWNRLRDWLGEGFDCQSLREAEASDALVPDGGMPLSLVRLEFMSALDDIPTRYAADLLVRIRNASSLRDLWHLRADVFNAVSCYSNQTEARERLSRLNRHFPARAPKSGFGGFDAIPQGNLKS